jgi:putative transcriptional regulator
VSATRAGQRCPRATLVRRLAGTAVLLLALGFGAEVVAQAPEDGFFLVAKPSLLDPNFQRTVVLVANAPDGATLGVIVNRPTRQSLANILPGNPTLARFTDPLHFGGPVERVGLFAVFRAEQSPGPSFRVVEDLHLALDPVTVEQLLLKPPAQVRFFNGYSGWAPGQLAGELRRGDWWVVTADLEAAFRKDTSTLWDELSARAQSVTAGPPPAPARYAASR